MIIAYPTVDLVSRNRAGKTIIIQPRGRAIRLIQFHGNVAILETSTGYKFSTAVDKLVYYDTTDKGPSLVF